MVVMAPVRLAIADNVARLTLQAPNTGNALDATLVAALAACLAQAVATPGVRALVLDAEGPVFCNGLALGTDVSPDAIDGFRSCLQALVDASFPVIACVDAPAWGGGVGLIAACDLVIAGDGAKLALSEALAGLVPITIAPFLLRRVSPARLRALALGMRQVGAAEALAIGLVDEIATRGVDHALERQLRRIMRATPCALAEVKTWTDGLPPDNGTLMSWLTRSAAARTPDTMDAATSTPGAPA